MAESSSATSGWLSDLIALTVSGIFTLIGGGLVWVAKKILLDVVREEIERKHKENKETFVEIKEMLQESKEDRGKIRTELANIQSDVSYLKGRVDAEDER